MPESIVIWVFISPKYRSSVFKRISVFSSVNCIFDFFRSVRILVGIFNFNYIVIFQVKSVNLDSWTPEQVQSMRVMGNKMARRVYEAELPEHFRRPQTDSALESFIRAKYEQKRW